MEEGKRGGRKGGFNQLINTEAWIQPSVETGWDQTFNTREAQT